MIWKWAKSMMFGLDDSVLDVLGERNAVVVQRAL